MGGLDGYVLVEAKIEVALCQQMNVSKSLGWYSQARQSQSLRM